MARNSLKKRLILIAIPHFALSLGAFVGLKGWAVGVQDAGTAVDGAPWLEGLVDWVLLQPLAHWVVEGVAIAWWTWPGLATTAVLFGLNSVVVAALASAALETLRMVKPQQRS
jgi:hypothetical protein